MKFNTIWNNQSDYLFNFIKDQVDTNEIAEDILQEIAIKFNRALESRIIKNPESWLFQVARNTIADHYRKTSKNQAFSYHEIPEIIDNNNSSTCYCDLSGFVIKNYLPEKYGNPLYMADIEKVPHKEIAAKMNLSLTAAKSRIQRARILLKERIETCIDITYRQDGSITGFDLKKGCDLPRDLLNEIERLNLSI
ncbi:hypothetical protein OO013_17170 [Mangrovivirga sp. M17]|uniref:Sigma-70 family RNA polymerase sigma factor n=1 Tax=Mangrovivirga halotolerans TaxID=2993936 RepID=A0ABT3RV10_9BACT|nr:sigma factor-like helix-turn-helix DNA-binding protein [Mangrovivirga halotolerans]MCX2745616.1 hypothetical protein [Mangrovivirga halotolerans]